MKRRHRLHLLLLTLFLSIAALAAFAVTPGYTVRYDINDLGTFGGFSSKAFGINNKSQVVGGADGPGGVRRGFLWENGAMIELPQLEQGQSHEAEDINELGVVVGRVGGNDHGFLWDGKTIQYVALPPMPHSAYAINDAGQIVGSGKFPPPTPTGLRAWLYEDGVMTDLAEVTGSGWGIAWDINELGQVGGGAHIWAPASHTLLPTLGGDFTGVKGINDRGDATGASERVSGELIFHAFLWQDGEMTDIGLLIEPLFGFVNSNPEAINNEGQVVGYGTVQINAASAGILIEGFLFDPIAGPALLKDTLPENSGWSYIFPTDINDKGQIVGAATTPEGFRHAFLMTPLPPIPATSPALLVLLTIATLIAAYVLLTKRAASGGACSTNRERDEKTL